MVHDELILVLDFGSQYTQLIARRIRELNVYSEIRRFDISIEDIKNLKPKGIILSGGPSSVYAPDAPIVDKSVFDLSIPILGICYGLQLIAHTLGGEVARATHREYGHAQLHIDKDDALFTDLDNELKVWMSHGDRIISPPPDRW